MILDEPNASLDSEGEAALMEAIQALKRARSTVIVISHKTEMLAAADKVLKRIPVILKHSLHA